jgi:hypothetical protein
MDNSAIRNVLLIFTTNSFGIKWQVTLPVYPYSVLTLVTAVVQWHKCSFNVTPDKRDFRQIVIVMVGLKKYVTYCILHGAWILLNNSMGQSPSWEANRYWRNFPHFMEPLGSLQRLQQPATGPYSEPDRSSPRSSSHFSKVHFNIILPSTARSSTKWLCYLKLNVNLFMRTSTNIYIIIINILYINIYI